MRRVTSLAVNLALALSADHAAPPEASYAPQDGDRCINGAAPEYRGMYTYEETGERKGQPTDPTRVQLLVGQAATVYVNNVEAGENSYPYVWLYSHPSGFWENHGLTHAGLPAYKAAKAALSSAIRRESESRNLEVDATVLGTASGANGESLADELEAEAPVPDQVREQVLAGNGLVIVTIYSEGCGATPLEFVDPR